VFPNWPKMARAWFDELNKITSKKEVKLRVEAVHLNPTLIRGRVKENLRAALQTTSEKPVELFQPIFYLDDRLSICLRTRL